MTQGNDLQEKREQWHKRLVDFQDDIFTDPPWPEHLYHYSSTEKIKSIISGRTFWAFDLRTMKKDPRDGLHWVDVFRPVVMRKSVPRWLQNEFRFGGTFGMGEHWTSFASCFSPECGLMSQWEEYGDHGRGCAIELSFEAFMKAANGGTNYGWTPIAYDEFEQIRAAERTIDFAIEVYRSGNMTAREAEAYWREVPFSCLVCGTRYKHRDFEKEREWRMFFSRTSECSEVREHDGRRYFPWELPSGLVAGIVKGPNCECPDAELEALLSAADCPQKVRQAQLNELQPFTSGNLDLRA